MFMSRTSCFHQTAMQEKLKDVLSERSSQYLGEIMGSVVQPHTGLVKYHI